MTQVEIVSDTQTENVATKLRLKERKKCCESGSGEIETETIGGPGMLRSHRLPSPVTDGASANGTREEAGPRFAVPLSCKSSSRNNRAFFFHPFWGDSFVFVRKSFSVKVRVSRRSKFLAVLSFLEWRLILQMDTVSPSKAESPESQEKFRFTQVFVVAFLFPGSRYLSVWGRISF